MAMVKECLPASFNHIHILPPTHMQVHTRERCNIKICKVVHRVGELPILQQMYHLSP